MQVLLCQKKKPNVIAFYVPATSGIFGEFLSFPKLEWKMRDGLHVGV
jgi:hypothetical protein